MLKSICFAGALLSLCAVPALAAMDCGSAPIAPAIPGVNDIAGKTAEDAHQVALSALKSVKHYQGTLASFRECLKTQTGNAQAALKEAKAKGEKDKVAEVQAQIDGMQSAWDKTVDTETKVVKEYMDLHDGYCKMGTGLPGCAK